MTRLTRKYVRKLMRFGFTERAAFKVLVNLSEKDMQSVVASYKKTALYL
ncbi:MULTISPECIES: hypothetical protein [Vibrio]|uniref:Uncharacterized protein n=1 Tax=Vibrio cyclitrophicus TaxID=47951 RepID=A0ACD5G568_9VIBR|nr:MULTISPECIES: hypothetical protein [Vibrio]